MISGTIVGSTYLSVKDQLWAIFWSAPGRIRIFGTILGVTLCVMIASDLYTGSRASIPIVGGVVIGLGLLLFLIAAGFRRLSKEQRLVTYEVDLDQIAMRDATGTTLILPWAIVSRVMESRSGFAIGLKPRGTRWIPKRAFAAETLPHLRSIFEMAVRK